jgi:hypothetical protein
MCPVVVLGKETEAEEVKPDVSVDQVTPVPKAPAVLLTDSVVLVPVPSSRLHCATKVA